MKDCHRSSTRFCGLKKRVARIRFPLIRGRWDLKINAGLMAAALLCGYASVAATESPNPWTHSLYFENDLFVGTDGNYTNGVKYVLISPDLSPHVKEGGNLPRKVLGAIHKIPFIRESPPETSHKVEFAFGQNMFTPKDTEAHELIENDRPYAGWTYFATAYHHKSDLAATFQVMDTVELQLGVVGPLSLAEESQKTVHRLRGLKIPNGWDHQLSNEPGIVIAWERKWLVHPVPRGFGWDTIVHSGFTLGNVSTYINGGMEFRLGWNIPETFGVSLIRPAGSTRMDSAERPGFYLVAGIDGQWVVRDIFLDGNTFTGSHSIAKKPFVAAFAAGIAFNYDRFMLTFTNVWRTRKFKAQPDNHSYGAIALSWVF